MAVGETDGTQFVAPFHSMVAKDLVEGEVPCRIESDPVQDANGGEGNPARPTIPNYFIPGSRPGSWDLRRIRLCHNPC